MARADGLGLQVAQGGDDAAVVVIVGGRAELVLQRPQLVAVRLRSVQAAAQAIDMRLRLLRLATLTERAQEVRDGLKRVIGIGEVPFRTGRDWMQIAVEIAIGHDRDEQMRWLDLDSDDTHTGFGLTRHDGILQPLLSPERRRTVKGSSVSQAQAATSGDMRT